MVLMDDRLFAARDVTKTNSTRVETFQAPERGPLAIVDPEGVFYRSRAAGRATAQFDITDVNELPRVDVVYSYAGADSVAIDALVAAGAKGLVDCRRGTGRHDVVTECRGTAAPSAKGVVVITSTRTGSGRVPVGSAGDTIGSGDLNAQKARVLLCLALTRTNDPAQIRKIFTDNQ